MMDQKARISDLLMGIDSRGRILFAALCCERLLPNYEAFTQVERWGSYKTLRGILDQIWGYLHGQHYSERKRASMLEQCEKNMPDSEEFTSVYSELASDVVEALMLTLASIDDSDGINAVNVSLTTINSIQNYLESVADPRIDVHGANVDLEEWVHSSPLMRVELAKQISDLEQIHSALSIDGELIQVLRESSMNIGIQPKLRGLIR